MLNLMHLTQCFSNTFGRGPKKRSKNLGGPMLIPNVQVSSTGETSRGPSRAIFSPRGPNVPIYHVLPTSRRPFFFARGPFMARGLLFEKH